MVAVASFFSEGVYQPVLGNGNDDRNGGIDLSFMRSGPEKTASDAVEHIDCTAPLAGIQCRES